jgi:uncharacterized C2H2 Zn-finger protein
MKNKMKIIETYQEDLIVCDNQHCDFKIINETGDINTETKQYINIPCPKCGENLLTQKDYDDFEKLRKTINWVNKWFGWLSVFGGTKKIPKKATFHVHEGIKQID